MQKNKGDKMKPVWKWILGILAALLVIGLFAGPFIMRLFFPYSGYAMMNGGWGRMPMHNGFGFGGSPMMGGFGMSFGLFSGLIQLGVLALIVLGIIWLYKAIKNQDAPKNN